MPDYNPAIAAGIQPTTGLDFGKTLSTVADYQRAQAAAQLTQLQALQQQRKFNGLMAFDQALTRNPGDIQGAYHAGVAGGADMQDLNNGLAAYSTSQFMQGHQGQNPQAAEAQATIGLRGAETTKARAETTVVQSNHAAQLAGGVISSNGTNTKIWNDSVNEYFDAHGGSPLERQQYLGIKDPNQRLQIAKALVGAGLTPEQGVKQEAQNATDVYTSPYARLGGQPPVAAGTGPQTGAAPNTTVPGNQSAPIGPQALETQKGFGTENVADLKAANARYDTAAGVQSGLLQLENHLDEIPQGGWFMPGKDAGKRIALAKAINTAVGVAGGNPIFDPNTVAAAEATQKGTTKLGFDLAKTLGSREAAMIVQQSIGVQPGVEMTPQGNRRIITGLMAAAQRDKDYGQFVQQYMKQNPNMVPGEANTAFNQAHPPTEYVNAVNKILSIDPKYVKLLRDNPSKAADFDAKFNSPGISRFLIGG